MTDPNHPAIPNANSSWSSIGITKRELFAMVAMHAFLLRGQSATPGNISKYCIEQADSLVNKLDDK